MARKRIVRDVDLAAEKTLAALKARQRRAEAERATGIEQIFLHILGPLKMPEMAGALLELQTYSAAQRAGWLAAGEAWFREQERQSERRRHSEGG